MEAAYNSTGVPVTPDWLIEANRTSVGQAGTALATPYQGYSGTRLADFTPDQLNAMSMVRGNAAGTVADPAALKANMQYGLSAFDPNEVNKYMSPYTTGVVDEIGRLGNKELFQQILPQVNSTFQGAGQFGSTRNADFTNTAIQNQNYSTLGLQAKALQDATTAGMDNYAKWHQNALPNATAAEGLTAKTESALGLVGAQQQAQNQQSMDLAYQDFTNQNNFAKNNLDWYTQLIKGLNVPQANANVNYNPNSAPSPVMQGLSAAAQIYGNFK